ncbi:molybdenum cofactor guanylyltransferase [Ilumatobacter sp.]|uniref:molybdenum cofactor guanylyltransferase n=1 Tax=Ilumatobacter sp. TaxID=1967498 RepID=UPI003C5EBFD1
MRSVPVATRPDRTRQLVKIAGVVLTGGASRRMGRTKATIDVDGRPMADHVLDALRGVGAEPLILVGGDASELADLSAPVVDDQSPGAGPVGGVLSALDHLAKLDTVDAALILPCDLVSVTSDTLWPIVEAAVGDGMSLAWVAATERLEPMCTLWSLNARGVIRERFVAGERALHRVIAEIPHTTVTVDPAGLRNVNRPEDLGGDDLP